jgi:hypothetical protein
VEPKKKPRHGGSGTPRHRKACSTMYYDSHSAASPVSMLTGCSADASRCRRKLGKRWPGQMESDSTWRDISCVLRNRSRKRLKKNIFYVQKNVPGTNAVIFFF